MNINGPQANSCELHKICTFGQKNSPQLAVKCLSEEQWVQHKDTAHAEQTPELGCILPDCHYPSANLTIPERKVSHLVTTGSASTAGSASTDSRNPFEYLKRSLSDGPDMGPVPRKMVLQDSSTMSSNGDIVSGEAEVLTNGSASKTFTAEEVAGRVKTTIEYLIRSLKYDQIIREFDGEDDQSNEVIGVFIDFILYQEGLVNDRCFTVASRPDKYVPGNTVSQARVEDIQSDLKDIFTERKAAKSVNSRLSYSLGEMLVDYLSKKENVPNDIIPEVLTMFNYRRKSIYDRLLKDIFPFFETLLAGKGLFSELGVIFNFAITFRHEIIDGNATRWRNNLLISSLRINNSGMREYFNRHVMDVIFAGRCDAIVNAPFDSCSLPTDSAVKPASPLKLTFGEELEYDLVRDDGYLERKHQLVNDFASRLQEKGMSLYNSGRYRHGEYYGFSDGFVVNPFLDTDRWFEINCTPYHADDRRAESCFEKVIDVIDSMRNDELISYSSGHKHIDVLSATQGDTDVLLAMESEIQRNPFLLRAFGNNDRIVRNDEMFWYKTFADYNPDTKPFAVQRLNWMIDRYNKKIAASCAEDLSGIGGTESEKKDRLEQFAHFYSQFVHMTTLQNGLGVIDDDNMEKYMAMSLLHITGASEVVKLSTLEFRFFRCPKTVEEIKLINRFLQAWFHHLHQCKKDKIPLQLVPEDIQSCRDYTAGEVQTKTIDYLSKLGLNPEDYRCFWGDVRDIPLVAV
ncbi:hypothetical protein [Endozoicomonas sp. SCSIO W0465]|uniref:hypothetical protein n=1 Tax=Endozoicomonas sp. SCSIO W0465 TaxID=2918516 RepID=UPI002074D7D1|nr:hypothetical protein [Endozoicomonas sp. SCSIO W0465]USE37226.1 hypothetical protein MJO57_03060 [Endozoicomonas sp. SCSIO W0465]